MTLSVYYPFCQLFVSLYKRVSEIFRILRKGSYTGRGAGWLNALAATLDLDGVELGLGGDGHGGGDGDAKSEMLENQVINGKQYL